MSLENETNTGYTIERESHRVYRIINNKTGKVYRVWFNENNLYTCTCLGFEFGSGKMACRHILLILKLEGKI